MPAKTEKKVWEKPKPKSAKKPQKLTEAQKEQAKARAKKAGRRYPNLVDNMYVLSRANR